MSSQDKHPKNTKQRIYLSRHWQTQINALAEAEDVPFNFQWALDYGDGNPKVGKIRLGKPTPKGRRQAITLAKYFKQFIVDKELVDPKEILVVTSTFPRSFQTGERVRVYSHIPEENRHSTTLLKEDVPKEILRDEDNKNPYFLKKLARSRTKNEILSRTLGELYHACSMHPEKTIIATLHSTIDHLMLGHLGVPHGDIGNCCLIPLDYDHFTGKVTLAGDYLSNDDMAYALLMAEAEPHFKKLECSAFYSTDWRHSPDDAQKTIVRIIDDFEGPTVAVEEIFREGSAQNRTAERLDLLHALYVTGLCTQPNIRSERNKNIELYEKKFMGDK